MEDKVEQNSKLAQLGGEMASPDKAPLVYFMMPRFGENLRNILKFKKFVEEIANLFLSLFCFVSV